MTMEVRPDVYIVDDDVSVRRGLGRLVRSAGYNVEVFSSAHEFLASLDPNIPACLVLDVSMPEMNGLELQETLNSLESHNIPIIFITGHGDIPMSVKAMKAGAGDFLSKPVNDRELLDAISLAIENHKRKCEEMARASTIKERLACLTPREFEVFRLVVTGIPNKQIAGKLGIVENTVKIHRSRIMHKLKADSIVCLARLAQDAGIV